MELISFDKIVDSLISAPPQGSHKMFSAVAHYEIVVRTPDGKVLHHWVPAEHVTVTELAQPAVA